MNDQRVTIENIHTQTCLVGEVNFARARPDMPVGNSSPALVLAHALHRSCFSPGFLLDRVGGVAKRCFFPFSLAVGSLSNAGFLFGWSDACPFIRFVMLRSGKGAFFQGQRT